MGALANTTAGHGLSRFATTLRYRSVTLVRHPFDFAGQRQQPGHYTPNIPGPEGPGMFGSAVETCSLILYRPRKASGSMAEAAEVAASKAAPGSSVDAASMPATSESRLRSPHGVTSESVTVSGAPSTPGIAV